MSFFRRIDPYTCSPLFITEIIEPSPFLLGFPSFIDDVEEDLDLFESVTDLVQIRRRLIPDYPIQYLCDRVSQLETKFDRLSRGSDRKYTLTKEIKGSGERKYKWEAEIQGPPGRKYKVVAEGGGSTERKYKWETEIDGPGERKYKWTAEIKGGKKDDELALKKAKAKAIEKKKKKYNLTTELKSERENGELLHTYTIKASTGSEKVKHEEKEKKEKKKSKKKEKPRVVVIEEEEEEDEELEERRAIVLKKVFLLLLCLCFVKMQD